MSILEEPERRRRMDALLEACERDELDKKLADYLAEEGDRDSLSG